MSNVMIEDGNEVIEYVDVEHNALEVATNVDGLLFSFYGVPILTIGQVADLTAHLLLWVETGSLGKE